ncbi:ribonuclease H-like domain-containing protein [Tanacetum coccineum]
MLDDFKLPTTFWAEAVNTSCYVQNRVLVIKPHNKTPYELFLGRKPALGFMRPFGCPVTILNTIDHLGKFDGKADEGFFVGYSINRSGPNWLFDIDALTKSINYKPVAAGNQSNGNASTKSCDDVGDDEKKIDEDPRKDSESVDQKKDDNVNKTNNVNAASKNKVNAVDDGAEADMNNLDTTIQVSPNLSTRIHKDHPLDQVIGDLQSATQTRRMSYNLEEHGFTEVKTISTPLETQKPLLKDEDGEEVDVHMYRSMIGSLMYLTSSRPDTMYCKCVPELDTKSNPKCKKQTVVANSTTEAEYVAASSCYGQILWIHNQLLDYGRDLQLKDAEGVDCLPNATIFEQLALMGYEKISQKLTFYKAFFSQQWKFLIHMILQCLSAKTTTWNEFSSTMASVIIYLAINQKFNFSKYIFESMVKNLENVSCKFLMYPRFVQVFLNQQLEGMPTHKRIYITPSHTKKIFRNMRRVGIGFSGRNTPLFQTMVVQDQAEIDEDVNEEMDDSLVRAATIASSLEAEQDSGGGPKRQETVGDTIAQTRSENVSKLSNDPLLARGNTLQSGEDSLKLKELMALCITLQSRFLALETTKTTQANEIKSLKKRVKKLERRKKSRTQGLKRLYKLVHLEEWNPLKKKEYADRDEIKD